MVLAYNAATADNGDRPAPACPRGEGDVLDLAGGYCVWGSLSIAAAEHHGVEHVRGSGYRLAFAKAA